MGGCVYGYKPKIIFYVDWEQDKPYISNFTYVYEKCPVDWGHVFVTLILVIFFIVAFLLSTIILVTICSSKSLRKTLISHFIINICVTVMADCLLNLTVAISYVAIKYWKFGFGVCYFNSFTVTVISIQAGFGVLMLAMDRVFVANKFGSYMNMSKNSVLLLILFSWFISIGLALPLSWGLISSLPYRNRYVCSVADPYDDYYLIPEIFFAIFLIPISLINCLIITASKFHHEQKKHRKVRNQSLSYLEQILMTPYYKNEVYSSICVFIIAIGYLAMFVPFTCVVLLTPLFTEHWNGETTPFYIEKDPDFNVEMMTRLGVSQRKFIEEKMENITSNSSNIYGIIPEMRYTPSYETAFIWFRFMYDVMVPIVILVVLEDIRYKCKALLFVCRPNTVDSSSNLISPPYLDASFRKETRDKKKKTENMVNFRTPVLFATSEGLYIRTIDEKFQDVSDSRPLLGFSKQSEVEPHFLYNLCDVTLGGEDITDFEGNIQQNDQYEFEKNPLDIESSYNNGVVQGAQRAALLQGQKQRDPDRCCTSSAESQGKRPPTPPKPKSPDAVVADDVKRTTDTELVPIDLEEQPKKGKVVRFNTDLNEEIFPSKTSETDSILESSIASKSSNGSGSLGDKENIFSPPCKTRKAPTKIKKRRTNKPNPSRKTRSRNQTIHTMKPPPKLQVKRLGQGASNRPQPLKKQGTPGKQQVRPKKPRIKNIKSRYMGYNAKILEVEP